MLVIESGWFILRQAQDERESALLMVSQREIALAKMMGWLWIALAAALLATAAFFSYVEFRGPQTEDPADFGLVFGVLCMLASLPLMFCGTALVRGWRGPLGWSILPPILLVWYVRSYFL